jgi:TRAP-type C4-dicarboxylate transport system permease small subunit
MAVSSAPGRDHVVPEGSDQAVPEPPPVDAGGRIERACQLLCDVALLAMVVIIGAEALARSIFHVALEVADELGGYLLVAISFLSLSVCQATHAFHQLDLVQPRLSIRNRAICAVLFDLLALGFSAVLLWQLGRLEWISWTSGDVAPTELQTPLWIPRLVMPLGVAALCATLLKKLVKDMRRLAQLSEAKAR